MADKTLTAHLRVTGENATKAGIRSVGEAAERAGDQLEDMGKDAGYLAKQAEEASASVKDLIRQLNETGDMSLLKDIRKGQRQERLFLGLQKQLEAEIQQAAVETITPATGAGGLIGEGLAKGIGAAVAAAGPAMWGGIVAAAAAAMPFVGGVVASAVLGGVGAGGIAGGIALASQDSAVQAAAEQLSGTLKTSFTSAAEPFVAVTVGSLGQLERAGQDVAANLGQGFRTLAPVVKPLTEGLIGLSNEAMPGLLKGMEAAKPVLRTIANELPEIGEALGDMIGDIGDEADGASMAFHNMSEILQGTLRLTGNVISALSGIYEWSVRTSSSVAGFANDTLGWLPVVGDWFGATDRRAKDLLGGLDKAGDASRDFAGDLRVVGKEADTAAAELDAMKAASDRLFGVTMDLDRAMIEYRRGIKDLRDELIDGAKTLNENTDAGLDNIDAVTRHIQLAENWRQAEAKSTLGLEEANKRYAERLEALKKDMLQLGYNRAEVDKLIARYLAVPKAIEIEIKAKAAGDATAWSMFRAIERQRFEKNRTVGNEFFTEFIEGRASGGPTRAGRTYLVGENGPEIWSENSNGHMFNAGQTQAMLSGASGGARPQVSVMLMPSGHPAWDALVQAIWPALTAQIRIDGGDLTSIGAS